MISGMNNMTQTEGKDEKKKTFKLNESVIYENIDQACTRNINF